MIADMVVVADGVSDLLFKITRQIIVLEQDAVFEGLMPTRSLALGLRMQGCATGVIYAFVTQPAG
jgi:hypothetical protein